MEMKKVGRPALPADEKRIKRPFVANSKEWEIIETNAEEFSGILGTKDGKKNTNNFLCYVGAMDIDILRKAIEKQEKRRKL